MSAKSIFEADGKAIINYHLTRAPVIKPTPLPAAATHNPPPKLAHLHFPAGVDVKGVLDQAEATYPWLLASGSKFVAKPDQLIKRRGKSGLLALNKTWAEAREWIQARAGKPQKVETVEGVLRTFLVEPFVPHPQNTEYYININSVREVCNSFIFCFERMTALRLGNQLLQAGRGRAGTKKSGVVRANALQLKRLKCSGRAPVLFNGRPGEGKADPGPLCRAHTFLRDKSAGFWHVKADASRNLSCICCRSCTFFLRFTLRLLDGARLPHNSCQSHPNLTADFIPILGRLDPLHPRGWCRCR